MKFAFWCVCVCDYVCVWCVCVCMCECVRVYRMSSLQTRCVCVFVCGCICVCEYVSMCVCVSVSMCVCVWHLCLEGCRRIYLDVSYLSLSISPSLLISLSTYALASVLSFSFYLSASYLYPLVAGTVPLDRVRSTGLR